MTAGRAADLGGERRPGGPDGHAHPQQQDAEQVEDLVEADPHRLLPGMMLAEAIFASADIARRIALQTDVFGLQPP
ncbi:hypothetical protein [Marilutibacter chinensis]|uniref:Uncharacterized protein n=1 Tax=Marilutibacter chinensis TaxID=2912247 RepID=A0ABS9HSG9_9GAMM|nr:hypothetical protein [Lysobacter chinensis]MCF7221072.1 hypothetical protein [Lysobacter chinensis]